MKKLLTILLLVVAVSVIADLDVTKDIGVPNESGGYDLLFEGGSPNKLGTKLIAKGHHLPANHVLELYPDAVNVIATTNYSTNTVAIGDVVYNAGQDYKSIMEEYVGVGSHTNQALSKAMVTGILSIDTNFPPQLGFKLEVAHQILMSFNEAVLLDSKGYHFPFGQTNYTFVVPYYVYILDE